jgi:hypothetical protein
MPEQKEDNPVNLFFERALQIATAAKALALAPQLLQVLKAAVSVWEVKDIISDEEFKTRTGRDPIPTNPPKWVKDARAIIEQIEGPADGIQLSKARTAKRTPPKFPSGTQATPYKIPPYYKRKP